jgi:hypothetical protein
LNELVGVTNSGYWLWMAYDIGHINAIALPGHIRPGSSVVLNEPAVPRALSVHFSFFKEWKSCDFV